METLETENSTANVNFLDTATSICGNDAVLTGEKERRFYSEDLFFQGSLPIAVVRPKSPSEISRMVKLCREHCIAIYPRGGGMSYSDAFQPNGEKSVILDTGELNSIEDIDPLSGHVTAGAGCTWIELDQALAKHGLRARFWGPMSGGTATLGGSLSQGSVTFGSGIAGASANAVKSFEIVAGTGEILHTGSDGAVGTSPHNRNYGPDLTGVFANDAGSMGIKTAVTLETEPRPEIVSGLSFAFDDFNAMARMFHEVTARRLSSEMIAMDAEVARQNAGQPDLMSDAKAMLKIGLSAGNPIAAIGRMASVALGGRRFLEKAHYTAHFVVEARDKADLGSKVKTIRGFAKGGDEIVNTVPLMTRADPFPSLPVTHPDGRRMLPMHGIFPTPALAAFHRDYLDLKVRFADQMKATDVAVAEFFASIAGVGLLYEPVFYWPDERYGYHEQMTPDYLNGKLPTYPENPQARALVQEIIAAIVELMREHGSSHFQIGRLYPCLTAKEESSASLLGDLKARLDPDNIINPGVLGL
ncbi:FAD-binding oxidoreductase [Erythrobacter sp. W53]|uniref:FAD-binding oxidoreductase n=1 Tax=Erythrobacter sp. W53 TaxID=3425947 RepID=UPI003D768E3E